MKTLPLECVQMLKWNNQLAQRLKELRGKVSRKKLALIISDRGYSCSWQYIQKLEEARAESVSMELIEVFCEVLNIQLEDLLPLLNVRISPNFNVFG